MNENVELKDLVSPRAGEIRFNLNETLLSSDYSFDEVEFNIMTYYGVGIKIAARLAFDFGRKPSFRVRLTKGTKRGERERG